MLTSVSWRSGRPGVRHLVFGPEQMMRWPVEAQQIIEGRPHPRGRRFGGAAERARRGGVWECDEGRFELTNERDAVVLVLAGSLLVQTGHGDTLTLDAGDVATLPVGLECVFTVPSFCRCAFVEASEPAGA